MSMGLYTGSVVGYWGNDGSIGFYDGKIISASNIKYLQPYIKKIELLLKLCFRVIEDHKSLSFLRWFMQLF